MFMVMGVNGCCVPMKALSQRWYYYVVDFYLYSLTAAKQLKPKKSKDPAAQQHPTVINPVQHVPQANYQMPPEGRWVSTLPRTGEFMLAYFGFHKLYIGYFSFHELQFWR